MTADQSLGSHSRLLLSGLLLCGLAWLALAAHGGGAARPDLLETARDVHGMHLLAGLALLAIHRAQPFRWINGLPLNKSGHI